MGSSPVYSHKSDSWLKIEIYIYRLCRNIDHERVLVNSFGLSNGNLFVASYPTNLDIRRWVPSFRILELGNLRFIRCGVDVEGVKQYRYIHIIFKDLKVNLECTRTERGKKIANECNSMGMDSMATKFHQGTGNQSGRRWTWHMQWRGWLISSATDYSLTREVEWKQ